MSTGFGGMGVEENAAIITKVHTNNVVDLQLFGYEWHMSPFRNTVSLGVDSGCWKWPVILRAIPEKLRGFEFVAPEHRMVSDEKLKALGIERKLPTRATKNSAAYDFISLERGVIKPGEKMEFATDIKAYMQPDEKLTGVVRSSGGIKLDLMLANTEAVIDSDFYNNPTNDGNISIWLRNIGKQPVEIKAGDRIAQFMFTKYLTADGDNGHGLATREGGIGHTGK
jgi:dUTP pyrophosphatase